MNINNDPDIDRRYARADRFAWSLMVVLTFAGFIGLQIALRDFTISLVFGAVCFIGIISRELYLHWIFGGTPPPPDRDVSKPAWRGHILHIAFVMLVWLVPAISDGHLSAWSFVGALMTGGGLAVYLWWQQAHSSIRKGPGR